MNLALSPTPVRFGRIIVAGNDPAFVELNAAPGHFHWQLKDIEGKCQNFIADEKDAYALSGMSQTTSNTMFKRMVNYIKIRIGDMAKDLNPNMGCSYKSRSYLPRDYQLTDISFVGNVSNFFDSHKPHNEAFVTFTDNGSGKVYNFVAKGWDAVALNGLSRGFKEHGSDMSQLAFDYVQERLGKRSHLLADFGQGSTHIHSSLNDPTVTIKGNNITLHVHG